VVKRRDPDTAELRSAAISLGKGTLWGVLPMKTSGNIPFGEWSRRGITREKLKTGQDGLSVLQRSTGLATSICRWMEASHSDIVGEISCIAIRKIMELVERSCPQRGNVAIGELAEGFSR